MNTRLITLLFFAFMGLCGCSNTASHLHPQEASDNTRIHLHAQGVPDRKLRPIRKALEARGFVVRLRENELPSSNNLILYAAYDGVEEELSAIEKVLAQNGVRAGRRLAGRTNALGTHEYNPRNIGVYITSVSKQKNKVNKSRIREVFPLSMTNAEFVSMDCEQEYLYDFYADGRLEISQLAIPVEEVETLTLRWYSSSTDTITLSDGIEEFEYRKTESSREHPGRHSLHVVTYNIFLQPLGHYRIPYGCGYKSTFAESF